MDIYRNQPGSDDSAWGLVNAVTYYRDHVVGEREPGNRFYNSQFSYGATAKAVAYKSAMALIVEETEARKEELENRDALRKNIKLNYRRHYLDAEKK